MDRTGRTPTRTAHDRPIKHPVHQPKLIDLRHDLSHVHDFHLLALSETWLAPNIPNRLLTIDGYTLYRCDRPKTSRLPKGYGGVALLARDDISVEVLNRPTTGTSASNIEIIWALVRLDKHKRLLFASAYRHPTNTASQLALDFDDLESQLQFMLSSHPGVTVIIAGDLNACLLSTGSSTSTPAINSVRSCEPTDFTLATQPVLLTDRQEL